MPVGTCSSSAKTLQRSALPSELVSSRIKTLSLGFLPGRYIGYEGIVVTQSRPFAVEGHRDRVFQVGKLDLRGKQVDRVALRKRERAGFLVRGRDLDRRR